MQDAESFRQRLPQSLIRQVAQWLLGSVQGFKELNERLGPSFKTQQWCAGLVAELMLAAVQTMSLTRVLLMSYAERCKGSGCVYEFLPLCYAEDRPGLQREHHQLSGLPWTQGL